MRNEVFYNINKIIERDSKATTYKFALLRGVIDIIQDNSPYTFFNNNRAQFPTGLLVEKWLTYYYPILESKDEIPQINGLVNIAFSTQFKKIITAYSSKGGFSVFYNDLKNKGIPNYLHRDFLELVKKIRETITLMPMKYIGRSISNDFYSIFEFENSGTKSKSTIIDAEYIISNFGTFSIPFEYFEAFQVLGSFINGQDSILFKWAQFSVKASEKKLSIEKVLNEVLKSPITERDIKESKKIYGDILKKEGKIFCVWSGKSISNFDIDHVIPFSIWKNNDLWNLLPSQSSINNKKRDKIPSVSLIDSQKDLILHYWNLINANQMQRFQKEIQLTLLGNRPKSTWQETSIAQLQNCCTYLITNRGYEEWKI